MPINYTIEAGDSTISVADEYGFFAETIWNDPANAELKKKRKNMDILLPGDVLVIMDKRLKEESKPSEQKYKFRRKGIPAIFRLQLFDNGKPRANQKYVLTVDGRISKGTTNGSGILEESVSPQAREAHLVIGPDNYEVDFLLGQLDPAGEISGVQKRLANLGFDPGEIDGELSADTVAALLAFQHRFGLQETGKPDAATLQKLEEVHDQKSTFPDESKN